jgi:hypothetical protein
MVEVAEEVGVDGCGVKVAVGSEVTTGEICSAEFVEEAGISENDIGSVRTQADRSIARHNITRPDRCCLMQDPSENRKRCIRLPTHSSILPYFVYVNRMPQPLTEPVNAPLMT